MRRSVLLSLLAATFLTLAPGCSSGDSTDETPGTGTAPATSGACAADTRKDVYAAGLMKSAADLQVRLLGATPGPLAKGTNVLELEIRDGAGAPIDGATVSVTPFMPDHGHGSAVKPQVSADGAGKYTVSKVYLAMAGLWKLTVSVQRAGGGALEETVFQFCLDG